ncbi:MAG: ABC transporter ATP-binding protein [Bacteroidetes bacterium]|nr:ABC transporter ATP-binding protein [Bacteroidota bacterium]MBV6462439.1 Arginine transport ATP-binding protein ArtM [Flavobacteriales bacterium]WKZ74392.1 MAG: ABC transporter ATP-binding protein [Vicingaceae bacterium]MCL4816987.1 ABC transporter ATP-binding protein [Flavobacteriales bacterium]NOG94666.1 ABC transporter ATP-binding protein [Bacteroidota bacterium]
MIELINVSKKFGRLSVLNNINLLFEEGQCVALIGPNGCGKTTLIKSILGMVLPDGGDIIFKEKNIKNDFEYRKNIGYMPQIGRYPENMSIGQVIEMIKNIRQSNNNIDEDLLNQFQLNQMFYKQMRTLSGGTTQKVSATLAFLFNPDVLILDEPTAGLDPLSSEILKEKILKEKQNGKLILITSHLLSELDELVSHLIFMQEGKINFYQSIETLKRETGEDKISKVISKILKQQN